MKLHILSRYSRLGASTRLRTQQYLPYLAAAGFEVEVANFFDDAYLARLYSGARPRRGMIRYFGNRLQQLRAATGADVIWLEKEALPWVPFAIEHRLMPRGVPVVSDYDDAVYHSYDQHRLAAVRALLGSKIDGVMANSAMVFAGNPYLADHARAAGARRVEIIPTVVDVTAYQHRPFPSADGKPRVGWIGTPRTWAEHGVPMLAMLSDIMARQGAVFRAIGAGRPPAPPANFEFPDWSEASEVRQIQGLDIGIMPLTDTPISRGKCAYKLIQYMACGVPVIASPIGVNASVVEHGVNGFLASTETEWRDRLDTLLADPDLRRRMGEAGRRKVVAEYSIQTYGPKVAALLAGVAAAGPAA